MLFPKRPKLKAPAHRIAAFTIVEIVVALGVIAILGAAAMVTLLSLNRTAAATRCYAGAVVAAQTHLDRTLSQPYWEQGTVRSDFTLGPRTKTAGTIYK